MRNTTSHNISMKAVVTKQNYDKRINIAHLKEMPEIIRYFVDKIKIEYLYKNFRFCNIYKNHYIKMEETQTGKMMNNYKR